MREFLFWYSPIFSPIGLFPAQTGCKSIHCSIGIGARDYFKKNVLPNLFYSVKTVRGEYDLQIAATVYDWRAVSTFQTQPHTKPQPANADKMEELSLVISQYFSCKHQELPEVGCCHFFLSLPPEENAEGGGPQLRF